MTSDQQLQLTVVAVGTAVEITNLSQCPFYFHRFRLQRGRERYLLGRPATGNRYFDLDLGDIPFLAGAKTATGVCNEGHDSLDRSRAYSMAP